MLKIRQKALTGSTLREVGWEVLVKNMGIINATRFMLQYETGSGNYTNIKKHIFKGKSVSGLCREIDKFERRFK